MMQRLKHSAQQLRVRLRFLADSYHKWRDHERYRQKFDDAYRILRRAGIFLFIVAAVYFLIALRNAASCWNRWTFQPRSIDVDACPLDDYLFAVQDTAAMWLQWNAQKRASSRLPRSANPVVLPSTPSQYEEGSLTNQAMRKSIRDMISRSWQAASRRPKRSGGRRSGAADHGNLDRILEQDGALQNFDIAFPLRGGGGKGNGGMFVAEAIDTLVLVGLSAEADAAARWLLSEKFGDDQLPLFCGSPPVHGIRSSSSSATSSSPSSLVSMQLVVSGHIAALLSSAFLISQQGALLSSTSSALSSASLLMHAEVTLLPRIVQSTFEPRTNEAHSFIVGPRRWARPTPSFDINNGLVEGMPVGACCTPPSWERSLLSKLKLTPRKSCLTDGLVGVPVSDHINDEKRAPLPPAARRLQAALMQPGKWGWAQMHLERQRHAISVDSVLGATLQEVRGLAFAASAPLDRIAAVAQPLAEKLEQLAFGLLGGTRACYGSPARVALAAKSTDFVSPTFDRLQRQQVMAQTSESNVNASFPASSSSSLFEAAPCSSHASPRQCWRAARKSRIDVDRMRRSWNCKHLLNAVSDFVSHGSCGIAGAALRSWAAASKRNASSTASSSSSSSSSSSASSTRSSETEFEARAALFALWSEIADAIIEHSSQVGASFVVPLGKVTGGDMMANVGAQCSIGALFALSFIETGDTLHLNFARKVAETCNALWKKDQKKKKQKNKSTPQSKNAAQQSGGNVAGLPPSAARFVLLEEGAEAQQRRKLTGDSPPVEIEFIDPSFQLEQVSGIFELLFWLHRATRESKYREWAEDLFRNIEDVAKQQINAVDPASAAFGVVDVRGERKAAATEAEDDILESRDTAGRRAEFNTIQLRSSGRILRTIDEIPSNWIGASLKFLHLMFEEDQSRIDRLLQRAIPNCRGHFVPRDPR